MIKNEVMLKNTEKGFKITLSNNNYDNTAALGFSLMWMAAG